MTVHGLTFKVAAVDPNGDPVDLQAKKDQAQQWVDNHQEVLQTESSNFQVKNTAWDESGEDYGWARWRFSTDEDLDQMRDSVKDWLDSNFQWWAITYHQCDHDEAAETRDRCRPDKEFTSSTSPPDAVLELA